MRVLIMVFIGLALMLAACQPQITDVAVTDKTATILNPTATRELPLATVSLSPPAVTPTPQVTDTLEPVAIATQTATPSAAVLRREGEPIIINHTNVDTFENIPDQYLEAASKLRLLLLHASVGWNIRLTLDCMGDLQPRIGHCHVLPPHKEYRDTKYNWTNWVFDFYQPPPSQNPGWYNKVSIFINRINSTGSEEKIDVATFKLGYVDAIPGSEIDEEFFKVPNTVYPTIQDLEDLERQYPQITFVYTTLALARAIGSEDSRNFNQQLREYALAHNKILLDLADIESHLPDGTPCFDMNGNDIEALCDFYTTEKGGGGHPSGLGSQRLAQAIWLVMARITGWDGQIER